MKKRKDFKRGVFGNALSSETEWYRWRLCLAAGKLQKRLRHAAF